MSVALWPLLGSLGRFWDQKGLLISLFRVQVISTKGESLLRQTYYLSHLLSVSARDRSGDMHPGGGLLLAGETRSTLVKGAPTGANRERFAPVSVWRPVGRHEMIQRLGRNRLR